MNTPINTTVFSCEIEDIPSDMINGLSCEEWSETYHNPNSTPSLSNTYTLPRLDYFDEIHECIVTCNFLEHPISSHSLPLVTYKCISDNVVHLESTTYIPLIQNYISQHPDILSSFFDKYNSQPLLSISRYKDYFKEIFTSHLWSWIETHLGINLINNFKITLSNTILSDSKEYSDLVIESFNDTFFFSLHGSLYLCGDWCYTYRPKQFESYLTLDSSNCTKILRESEESTLLHIISELDEFDMAINDQNLLGHLIARGLPKEYLNLIHKHQVIICFCCIHNGTYFNYYDNIVIKHGHTYLEFIDLESFMTYLDSL